MRERVLCFQFDESRPGGERVGSPAHQREGLDGDSGWYVCAHCGAPLAHQSWVLEPSSRDPLVVTNPHGKFFHLLLLTWTQGVAFDAWSTGEFTWFSGYAWRVGHCGSCQAHVGWRFEAVESAQPSSMTPSSFVALSRAALRFVDRA